MVGADRELASSFVSGAPGWVAWRPRERDGVQKTLAARFQIGLSSSEDFHWGCLRTVSDNLLPKEEAFLKCFVFVYIFTKMFMDP